MQGSKLFPPQPNDRVYRGSSNADTSELLIAAPVGNSYFDYSVAGNRTSRGGGEEEVKRSFIPAPSRKMHKALSLGRLKSALQKKGGRF